MTYVDFSKLRRMLNRSSFEYVASLPSNTAAGAAIAGRQRPSSSGQRPIYYCNGATSFWRYEAGRDAWQPLPNPSSALAGTFGAGFSMEYRELSAIAGNQSFTASAGGTTTKIATSVGIYRNAKGITVRCIGGTNVGYEGTIENIKLGASAEITVTPAAASSFDNTSIIQIWGGTLWVLNAGTLAANIFQVYDLLTNTWTVRAQTNLPGTITTDSQLVGTLSPPGNEEVYSSGTATAGGASTLTDGGKAWVTNAWKGVSVRITAGTGAGQTRQISSNTGTVLTVSSAWTTQPDSTSTYQIYGNLASAWGIATAGAASTLTVGDRTWIVNGWTNYQVRICGGTGAGQIRTISSNTATVLTVSSAWTVQPDATSVYCIEGNIDHLYYLGSGSVNMYRYSISANTWTGLAPSPGRSGAPISGMSADWIDEVPDERWSQGHSEWLAQFSTWSTSLVRQRGRFLYSWRGTGNILDVYDIALNLWVSDVNYGQRPTALPGAASCATHYAGKIFIMDGVTNRIYYFDIARNEMLPFAFLPIPQGAAVVGDKMAVSTFHEGAQLGYEEGAWLYVTSHTSGQFGRFFIVPD